MPAARCPTWVSFNRSFAFFVTSCKTSRAFAGRTHSCSMERSSGSWKGALSLHLFGTDVVRQADTSVAIPIHYVVKPPRMRFNKDWCGGILAAPRWVIKQCAEECVRAHQSPPITAKTRQNPPKHAKTRQNPAKPAKTRQKTPAFDPAL
eukprot:475250-Amphidinium_carterae.1